MQQQIGQTNKRDCTGKDRECKIKHLVNHNFHEFVIILQRLLLFFQLLLNNEKLIYKIMIFIIIEHFNKEKRQKSKNGKDIKNNFFMTEI